jgi:hypothetical protein
MAVALASVAVLLGGCGDASNEGFQPTLRTDSSSYRQGEVVGIQLKAGIIRTVGYNLCFGWAELERLDSNGWHPVRANLGPDEDTFCTAEQKLLSPLQVARDKAYLPRDLPVGTYRLAYDLEIEDERSKYRSNQFSVSTKRP